ncbi:MAG: BMP family ABC transporter substrate-binding protein [Oscillospiraceae bacterium]|nr:BMP family ABC transporter substrate-binding protein [Oscillospiraceae bacterium]
MKKHRLLSLILAGCMLLTACSGGDGDGETTSTEPSVTVTDKDGNPVTDDEGNVVTSIISLIPEEKELNVGFIYPGVAGGDAVSQIFESARVQAERVLNANTFYIENVLVSQFEDATAALVSYGCNVIIAASSRYANAVYDEARANSKVYFISVGGVKNSFNLACFQGEMYKAAYVCGMAAAYNSNSNILGVVADPAILSCYNIVDAYILGAKELTESATDVRLNYAWGNNDEENRQAIDDLIAQGCDVIFTASYSTFAVEYCEQRGVKVIGMAYNTPELAPENYLTGCFYNVTIFIVDMLRTVRYETSQSVTYLGGIDEGAVRLVDFNENCKAGTVEICDALYQLCAAGKAVIFNGEIKDNLGNVKVEKGAILKSGEILSVDWLEESVTEVKDFCSPVVEPLQSDLSIHH